MKSMWIGGIVFIIALMAGTYFVAGDAFVSDDYINTLTMAGAFAIISITVLVALKYVQQIKSDKASGDLAEESWDGLREYKNPIPFGWGISFVFVAIWAVWYMLLGYPTNQFSQIGQWNEETKEFNQKFDSKWAKISDEDLKGMGESIFFVQCAPCHGIDGGGISGKSHDLMARISKSSVIDVIKNGANNFKSYYPAGMPAGMLTDEASINEVARWIADGLKNEAPVSYAACAGCHGDNGEGIEFVAPSIKTYTDSLVGAVLKDGKKANIGVMPSFDGRINDIQTKALALYIRSMGGN